MAFQTLRSRLTNGFHPTFWVANGMELFERLAYYGQANVLSIFLRNHLKFDEVQAGILSSVFGGLIYMLPIFAGAIADMIGFKRAFSIAFSMLALGYFLIGSTGMEAFQEFYAGTDLFWALTLILVFTAIGGSFIKPSVLGTVAVTTTSETKSMGFAIYYWLVNMGAAIGPLIAFFVRDSYGIQFVFMVSAVSSLLMLFANIFLYKEVQNGVPRERETIASKFRNLVLVLANGRFMVFLLIFSLFWIMFWQTFIIVPFYITDHISREAPFEIIQSAGAWSIIFLQLTVNYLTRKIHTRNAIVIGFAISSLSWVVIGLNPTIPFIIAGIAVFAIGEMTQAPRYYEYISELAPPGQQGLFQGYAFLPIAIAWFVGGPFGGWLYMNFAKTSPHPENIWFMIAGIGVLATFLMFIYNVIVTRTEKA